MLYLRLDGGNQRILSWTMPSFLTLLLCTSAPASGVICRECISIMAMDFENAHHVTLGHAGTEVITGVEVTQSAI